MISFETWLKKHKERNSALGDLARDFIDDKECAKLTLQYLKNKDACADAIKTFKQAQRTYKAYINRQIAKKIIIEN